MKMTVWKCDWCGVEIRTLPDGWDLSEKEDLCVSCVAARDRAVEEAKKSRKLIGSKAPK